MQIVLLCVLLPHSRGISGTRSTLLPELNRTFAAPATKNQIIIIHRTICVWFRSPIADARDSSRVSCRAFERLYLHSGLAGTAHHVVTFVVSRSGQSNVVLHGSRALGDMCAYVCAYARTDVLTEKCGGDKKTHTKNIAHLLHRRLTDFKADVLG